MVFLIFIFRILLNLAPPSRPLHTSNFFYNFLPDSPWLSLCESTLFPPKFLLNERFNQFWQEQEVFQFHHFFSSRLFSKLSISKSSILFQVYNWWDSFVFLGKDKVTFRLLEEWSRRLSKLNECVCLCVCLRLCVQAVLLFEWLSFFLLKGRKPHMSEAKIK